MTEVGREIIVEKLREFVSSESGLGDAANIGEHTNLLTTGVLDSLLIVSVISFCETAFDCRFESDEIEQEHFETIGALADQVCRKLGKLSVG